LRCSNRQPLPAASFDQDSVFYRGFTAGDLDDEGRIKVETLQSPDMSCNIGDLSEPADVRYRDNASVTDGCYQFAIDAVRFDGLANAVHDPLCGCEKENYSHCELRSLAVGEPVDFEPPAKRKRSSSKTEKKRRLAWRLNLRNSLAVVLPAVS